jgi:hypothetical protein
MRQRPSMRWVVGVLVVAGACSPPEPSGPSGGSSSATASTSKWSTTAISDDGKIQVDLPSGWEKTSMPGPGKLQLKCPAKNAFAIVISESKSDFTHETLADYAHWIITEIEAKKKGLSDRQLTGPTERTINGHAALVYEQRAVVNSLKLIYVKTFVESQTRWNQIAGWTAPSCFDDAKSDFEAIVQTFRETGN